MIVYSRGTKPEVMKPILAAISTYLQNPKPNKTARRERTEQRGTETELSRRGGRGASAGPQTGPGGSADALKLVQPAQIKLYLIFRIKSSPRGSVH